VVEFPSRIYEFSVGRPLRHYFDARFVGTDRTTPVHRPIDRSRYVYLPIR